MANRVTADDVKEILDTDLTDTRIDAFITGANVFVTKILGNKNLGVDLLKEIERWLSAHYIAATINRQAIEQVAGPVEQKFSDVFGKNLDSTTYGQTAQGLDPTGLLAKAGMKTVSFKAINENYPDF